MRMEIERVRLIEAKRRTGRIRTKRSVSGDDRKSCMYRLSLLGFSRDILAFSWMSTWRSDGRQLRQRSLSDDANNDDEPRRRFDPLSAQRSLECTWGPPHAHQDVLN